jgi:hypothetical protein
MKSEGQFHSHLPALQIWPGKQLMLQAPQFERSVLGLTH